jgi:hypothetical protein
MIQVSGVHFGVEPAENPPRLKRMLLPLVDGEIERHSLTVAATLARAAHMEVLLLAADTATASEASRSRRFRLSARAAGPTLHTVSRNLARHEADLRGRGVRVRSYLMRGGANDTVALLGRVATQEQVSMVLLTTGPRAAVAFPQAVRAALSMATPTLVVGATPANPFTHDVLRRTSVIVPTFREQHTTEGLLWAEALSKCCDGTILLLQMGRARGIATHADSHLLSDGADGSHVRSTTAANADGHAYWPASGATVRTESVTDFGATLARLRLDGPVLVILPITPAQLDQGINQAALRAIEALGVLTLIIPCEVTPPQIRDEDHQTREEESHHDTATHA